MENTIKLIAHRGNRNGPCKERENTPEYLQEAIDAGYYIEVDVRLIDGVLWAGHDEAQYRISLELLNHPRVYVHSKTIPTLYYFLSTHPNIHTFFHDQDEATITSKGEIWTYPGKELTPLSISVMPEWEKKDYTLPKGIVGVCSDYLPSIHG
jgi:glycerophosphoryl diester phosphodiesterase